jgi:membrane protein DedA with SNARE-associated domain
MAATLVLGIIALVLGLGLRYWINRRKFYRRSAFGSEGFSSYEKSVAVTFVERIAKWIAYALIILGALFLMSYYWQGKKKGSDAQKAVTVKHQAYAWTAG